MMLATVARLGEMAEVAAAVAFLASRDAAFVNATDLKVTMIMLMFVMVIIIEKVMFVVIVRFMLLLSVMARWTVGTGQ